ISASAFRLPLLKALLNSARSPSAPVIKATSSGLKKHPAISSISLISSASTENLLSLDHFIDPFFMEFRTGFVCEDRACFYPGIVGEICRAYHRHTPFIILDHQYLSMAFHQLNPRDDCTGQLES